MLALQSAVRSVVQSAWEAAAKPCCELPTYMRAAVVSNDRAAVKEWLATPGNAADSRHALYGETLLILAASRGLTDMVASLLRAGADVNLLTKKELVAGQRCSALMTAAVGGHEDTVQLLLDSGAHVDGVTDVLDLAHGDGLLSADQHQRLRTCCGTHACKCAK